jgi:hypothetical protein
MEYADFAKHCLKVARSLRDREDRIAHREMAAEWIRLAEMMTEDATHSAQRTAHSAQRTAHSVREHGGKTRIKGGS